MTAANSETKMETETLFSIIDQNPAYRCDDSDFPVGAFDPIVYGQLVIG